MPADRPDLEHRLARRGQVGKGWAPVGLLVDDDRREAPVAAWERTVAERWKRRRKREAREEIRRAG